jgi:hypothetical protein
MPDTYAVTLSLTRDEVFQLLLAVQSHAEGRHNARMDRLTRGYKDSMRPNEKDIAAERLEDKVFDATEEWRNAMPRL